MKDKFFKCFCCEAVNPVAFRDGHHEIPQAAGGQAKDVIELCSACHTQIHRIVYAVLNAKRNLEVEGLLLVFAEKDRGRAASLVNTVAQEMTLKADGVKDLSETKKLVSFEVTNEEYIKIMFAARDRRLSINNFSKGIILKAVEQLL